MPYKEWLVQAYTCRPLPKKCFIQWNGVVNNWKCLQLNITYDLFWRRPEEHKCSFSSTVLCSMLHAYLWNKQTKRLNLLQAVRLLFCKAEWKISGTHFHLMYHISFTTAAIFCRSFSGYIMRCCLLLNSNLWVANREQSPSVFNKFNLSMMILMGNFVAVSCFSFELLCTVSKALDICHTRKGIVLYIVTKYGGLSLM